LAKNEITKEENMNRMDNWIESRLMNAKKNKSAVSTKDLIAEIIGIFNLKISRQSIRNLKEKIKTVRNPVNKKFGRRKQTFERYARKLFVPTEMIQRWVENGLFPIQNPRKIERIMKVIEERDYFREVLSYQEGGFTIPIEKGTRLIQ
jgi:transcriptional regulator of heat shock response